MGWFHIGVVFVLAWWTVLFAVLPLWTRPVANPEEKGQWRGAPANPMIGRKLLVTTVLACIITAIIYAIVASDIISLRETFAPPRSWDR
ncbi:MAG: DUF1467 family protein [Alphaproteobacteria bacterium]|nr:DUF1467 family protein [Alphaproteobacteria bacterium]